MVVKSDSLSLAVLSVVLRRFFPEIYQRLNLESSVMVISRGLGNSFLPLQIFNFPELIVVTLKSN
jgi:predicted MPP superfamily phosphohydrolase